MCSRASTRRRFSAARPSAPSSAATRGGPSPRTCVMPRVLFPPARRPCGRARREARDRELRDGGVAPRRLSGQPRLLARAVGVDVSLGPLPQLRPFPPLLDGHRPRRGAPAVRGGGSCTRRPRTSSCSPSAATASAGRPRGGTPGPVGRRLVALPGSRLRPGGTGAVSSTPSTRAAFDGVLSIEHEDPVWGGTEERIKTGVEIAARTLRGVMAPPPPPPSPSRPRTSRPPPDGLPSPDGASMRRPQR